MANKDSAQNSGTITVNLRYTGKNGNARKFAEEMTKSGTVAKIRAEQGNIKYEYFISYDDPETLLLIDSWESQAAIDAHHATPMMQTIAQLREKYGLKMTAERYSPGPAAPAGDVINIPTGVKHWHGAAPGSWFSHLAMEAPGENPSNEWLEKVSDEDYNKLK